MEKPFQSLLTFSHSAGEKNILQSVLSFFSVFIFSMPRLAAGVKMSLSRAQNIFMPANINSIVITLETSASLSKHDGHLTTINSFGTKF